LIELFEFNPTPSTKDERRYTQNDDGGGGDAASRQGVAINRARKVPAADNDAIKLKPL
jgi:hypothetical protein